MAKPIPFDTVTRKKFGYAIEVKVGKLEIRGLVNGEEIYSVYVDDPKKLRVASAISPCGSFEKSMARVVCMKMVCDIVENYLLKEDTTDG